MTEHLRSVRVGAPDPEQRNSPIIEELAEDFEVAGQAVGEGAACWFNGQRFGDRNEVCSGNERLRCVRGSWVRMGSCDPTNP